MEPIIAGVIIFVIYFILLYLIQSHYGVYFPSLIWWLTSLPLFIFMAILGALTAKEF